MLATHPLHALDFDQSTYRPGDLVRLVVTLDPTPTTGELHVAIYDLDALLVALPPVVVSPGATVAAIEFTLPAAARRGYGVHVTWHPLDATGTPSPSPAATLIGACDVLEHWTQHPRYGFLSDFTPARAEPNGPGAATASGIIAALRRFHINGLQFYDWMYRHDHFLPPADLFTDPLGRTLSLAATRALIDAAHAANIAAIPYTAVYGASLECFAAHPDWVLFDAAGQPITFAGFLAIMDPRPGRPWTAHLLDQFDAILTALPFDGIHLDQYGEPKFAYDAQGHGFDLAQPLSDLIAATRRRVDAHPFAHASAHAASTPHGTVIFNCVGNWPVAAAAPAPQDLVYIEVWPPYTRFQDLHDLVVAAQALGGGKPVVLAAYLDPSHETNATLSDAVIFAAGGGRIELGEDTRYLADPYFPKHQPISPTLAANLTRIYDFAIRFQQVIGPATVAADSAFAVQITATDPAIPASIIWPILRRSPGRLAINLLHLNPAAPWQQPPLAAPAPTAPLTITIDGLPTLVTRAWAASPDAPTVLLGDLPIHQHAACLTLSLPTLTTWTLLVLELPD